MNIEIFTPNRNQSKNILNNLNDLDIKIPFCVWWFLLSCLCFTHCFKISKKIEFISNLKIHWDEYIDVCTSKN